MVKKCAVIFFVILLFAPFKSVAQDSATIYVMPSAIGKYGISSGYNIKVNSASVPASGDTIKVKTNYPGFDTVYYSVRDSFFKHFIVTRFKPNETYCITGSCCGNFIAYRGKSKNTRRRFDL